MFLAIDLFAATANAFNGALLAQRPDHYRGNYWTVVGILGFAVIGGIGGGASRDLLLDTSIDPLTNRWYLILCTLAGVVAVRLAYDREERFRERFYQLVNSFSLPWYAVVGAHKALEYDLPVVSALFIGVVGPTAGRLFIDVCSGVPAKQFVRGEWYIGTALLTSAVYCACYQYLGLGLLAGTLISVTAGFGFRLLALWRNWNAPMPRVPHSLLEGEPDQVSLEKRLSKGWRPGWARPSVH